MTNYKTVSVDYIDGLSFQSIGFQGFLVAAILYLNVNLLQNLYNVYIVLTSDF